MIFKKDKNIHVGDRNEKNFFQKPDNLPLVGIFSHSDGIRCNGVKRFCSKRQRGPHDDGCRTLHGRSNCPAAYGWQSLFKNHPSGSRYSAPSAPLAEGSVKNHARVALPDVSRSPVSWSRLPLLRAGDVVILRNNTTSGHSSQQKYSAQFERVA